MFKVTSKDRPHTEDRFAAVILAGSRASEEDPLSEQENESLKSLIRLAGIPMIDYVLKAVMRSGYIDDIYVSINSETDLKDKAPLLNELRQSGQVQLVDTESGPSQSAAKALESIAPDKNVLLTTADHPLLTRAILKEFLQKSLRADCDASLGVIPTDIIENSYPRNKRTRLKFREGGYTGCNLFALMSAEARKLPKYWENVEDLRKSPVSLATYLGPLVLTQYLAGMLTLDGAMQKISNKTGLDVKAVRMHQPEAGIDVDNTEDLKLVKDIIQNY